MQHDLHLPHHFGPLAPSPDEPRGLDPVVFLVCLTCLLGALAPLFAMLAR